MIRTTALILLATTAPIQAQDFAFRQECTLTLYACDMGRDAGPECPVDLAVAAKFWSEGESFNLSADGFGNDPADGAAKRFSLGQGYVTDAIRVYYIKDDPDLDGIFWIAADGKSGAHLSRNGLEDYFSATCTPVPD
ncbi:hypothetical protein [Tabrizicola sp.]|uniref:hypothetical protein n=1 Tax=Tabrizicola sp. TaxID=2005166 RepID=UPI003F34C99A